MKTIIFKGMFVLTMMFGMMVSNAFGYQVHEGDWCSASVIIGKTGEKVHPIYWRLESFVPFKYGQQEADFRIEVSPGCIQMTFIVSGEYEISVSGDDLNIEIIYIEVDTLPKGQNPEAIIFRDIRLGVARPDRMFSCQTDSRGNEPESNLLSWRHGVEAVKPEELRLLNV
ncbi:hypothetical protein [Butyricimonas hominis]|uniref:Uncharacterized protein n=1 Tax=Butyricimonas hominis TaxID=2763032 RepID=A0ABR7D5F7_9BACT|nr:hypothetical protein [Butyricimonas hominis]MBC5623167.1 hypothetical protein [Butyricimonas hominis]